MAGLKKTLLSSIADFVSRHPRKVVAISWGAALTQLASLGDQTLTNHLTQKELENPTPFNAALMGTGVSPQRSPEQFAQLERAALKMEDSAAIAAYETAVLDKYFPEFTYNGQPRYLIQVREQMDGGRRVKKAVEQSLSDPKTVKNAFGLLSTNRDVSNKSYKIDGLAHSQSTQSQGSFSKTAGYATPYYNTNFSSEKAFFSALNFSKKSCKTCDDNKKSMKCDGIIDPLVHRYDQMLRFQIAEHEVAHTISQLSDVRVNRTSVSKDPQWLSHVEENSADAYALLRIISKFGQEGIGFTKLYRAARARDINSHTQTENEGYKDNLDHWQIFTINNILARYEEHPEHLKDKTPPELFKIAQDIMRPLSPKAFAELRAIDLKTELKEPSKDKPEKLKTLNLFNRLAKTAIEPDVLEFIDYQVGSKVQEVYGMDEKLYAQLRTMPHAPASLGKKVKDFSDRELIDLARFDESKRKGVCPVSNFPDRFKLSQNLDEDTVKKLRQILPPRFQ